VWRAADTWTGCSVAADYSDPHRRPNRHLQLPDEIQIVPLAGARHMATPYAPSSSADSDPHNNCGQYPGCCHKLSLHFLSSLWSS
jgi:hypothetical protein